MSATLKEAGRTAVAQNQQGILQFLSQFPPFDQMEASHLLNLIEHARLRFFPAGQVVLQPQDGIVDKWYLIRQGAVVGQRPNEGSAEQIEPPLVLGPGDSFPLAALVSERPTRSVYRTERDTFCLEVDATDFARLLHQSEPLRAFALRGVSSLLGQLHRQAQAHASADLSDPGAFNIELANFITRQAVTCAPNTPLQQAVRLMHEKQVGSVAIVEQERLAGIFTMRDLRREVALEGFDLTRPIREVMTPDPLHLPPSAHAFDAALLMAQHRIGHMCIVRSGLLEGVISERDLFALQRLSLVQVARALRHAESVDTLAALRERIVPVVSGMMAQGADAAQLMRVITQLNDHTTHRAIELVLRAHGNPPLRFTWLCFGSEARSEQTLHTDQDNGILFEADDTADIEAIRGQLLSIASDINHALDRCGLTLCRGNVMAGNPELCLSVQEWHRRYMAIIRDPDPENLLKATIYFDVRALWGDARPLAALMQQVLIMVADNPAFQRLMAQTALSHRPPGGGLRELLGAEWGARETLDLKTEALAPLVDGARLLALAQGIGHPATAERFQLLAQYGVLGQDEARSSSEAFRYLQLLRMQLHQRQLREGEALHNKLAPSTLGALDRRILREALRHARRLQHIIGHRYRL
ncbi:MAG TPA: DUF294 nucleotidyltransferase-like domain-containing protein [Burkholderiaceae bacterium]|nr:DUF294 nucleotidyltransferase-like domain-containing protein [Burkholderiaceae bacterium]